MKFAFAIVALIASASAINMKHPSTGAPIPICNGANSADCTEADVVVKHRIRRPHKKAAPGDPDYKAQEAAGYRGI